MDWLSILSVVTPILLLSLGGIGWLYRHERERRESVERQLSEHKYNAYMELINIFFHTLKNSRKKKLPNEAVLDRMIDANKDLVIYGSDDVVETYLSWLASTRAGTANLELFGDVVIAIRRDMGNPKTRIVSHDILRMIITDFDDALATGRLKNAGPN